MSGISLTATSGLLGPIADALGWVLNLIYNTIGFHRVTLSIVIITIIIYMCLLPFTIKQQKFSKLSQIMQPEIQAIQNKYKGKKDAASMQASNQEIQLVYQKYGVSPSGSCIQMLIQMPILFALYRVFYNIPAYILSIKETFGVTKAGEFVAGGGIVQSIANTDGYVDKLQSLLTDFSFSTSSGISADKIVDTFKNVKSNTEINNYIVDILYKLPENGWKVINDAKYFDGKIDGSFIKGATDFLEDSNKFLGLNISELPGKIITSNFSAHNYLFVIIAIMIPVLSYLTQLINIKMMPTSGNNNDQMAKQMKTMNTFMPLMSFFIAFTVPVGLGIYWICSALVRIVQQFFINKHFQKIDIDDIIKQNEEKAQKLREKQGIAQNSIREAAGINTKSLSSKAKFSVDVDVNLGSDDKPKAKPGSMAAKANMVKDFNERNSRK